MNKYRCFFILKVIIKGEEVLYNREIIRSFIPIKDMEIQLNGMDLPHYVEQVTHNEESRSEKECLEEFDIFLNRPLGDAEDWKPNKHQIKMLTDNGWIER